MSLREISPNVFLHRTMSSLVAWETVPRPRCIHGKLALRKVQVVYYLHRRGGHVEHPHLLEGFLLPAQDGLRLRDFKNWLSTLRGYGMADSFSWSYKRNYKAGYIWQDLSGDDVIHPLQKNEYVLMGFEFQNQGSISCTCGQYSPEMHEQSVKIVRRQPSQKEYKLHEHVCVSPSKDSPKKKMQPGMINSAKTNHEHVISTCPSFKAENLQTSWSGFSDCDDNQLFEVGIKDAMVLKQRSGEVRVYKAKKTEQSTDVATQTGESKVHHHPGHKPSPCLHPSPLFTPIENHLRSTGHGRLQLQRGSLSSSHGNLEAEHDSNKSEMFYSPSSIHSSCTVLETLSPGSARSLRSVNSMNSSRFSVSTIDEHFQASMNVGGGVNITGAAMAPSPAKAKLASSAHLLIKQLLSCGSVDISHSSTFNLKAMSFHHAPAMNPLNTGTPPQANHERASRTRRQFPHTMHRLYHAEDASLAPHTFKSWLCRPCGGGNSSCFTPLEACPRPHHLSREGSLKDIDVPIAASRTFESPAPKQSPPFLNLNNFNSPQRRDPALVVRSFSMGTGERSSAGNWTRSNAGRRSTRQLADGQ